MLCTIIDMNKTDAFITLEDGTTMDITVNQLPPKSKIGDKVDIPLGSIRLTNDKFIDFF